MTLSKVEADIRKFRWEASKRARRTGRIKGPQLKRALELHIAGRYEEAIAEIELIPVADRSAEAWRVLAHAEHGRGNYESAVAAHLRSRKLHADAASAAAGDEEKENLAAATAEDEENLAAVFTSKKDYAAAWEATDRAFRLSPGSIMAWIAKISILNHQERHEELRTLLQALVAEKPQVLANPVFIDHLKNDTDFIGVGSLIESLKRSERD